MLAGGTVLGGRIISDRTGLKPASLYENRDLKPTTSLDAVIGGAAAAHFALDPVLAVPRLFPGSSSEALSGPIRG